MPVEQELEELNTVGHQSNAASDRLHRRSGLQDGDGLNMMSPAASGFEDSWRMRNSTAGTPAGVYRNAPSSTSVPLKMTWLASASPKGA